MKANIFLFWFRFSLHGRQTRSIQKAFILSYPVSHEYSGQKGTPEGHRGAAFSFLATM